MGRAAALKSLWMMTGKFEITYRQSVPLQQTLRCTARVEQLRKSRMVAVGEIALLDGTVAVEGRGLYLEVPGPRRDEFVAALAKQGVTLEGL